MSGDRVVWVVGDAPMPTVRALLGEGYAPHAAALDGPWRAPAGRRPVAALLVGGADPAAVRALRAAAQLPVVVVADGMSADDRHALLRAGAAGVEASPWGAPEGSSARTRATLRLLRTLSLAEAAPGRHPPRAEASVRALVIGASTGGPGALRDVLAGLVPRVPVLIAQHVSPKFDASLAHWLTTEGFPTRVASEAMALEAGSALLAPADQHLTVVDGHAALLPHDGRGVVPSVDALFHSAARAFGAQSIGVLLTGMGDDGARGLLALKQAGALTITQRGDTCVVDGMPARARDLLASAEDLTLPELRARLIALGALAEPSADAARAG